MGVATWRAVDTMGSEDVYTPKSGKRPKGHAFEDNNDQECRNKQGFSLNTYKYVHK